MLDQRAPVLPAQSRVLVQADRGLGTSPALLAAIAQRGWSFLVRVQRTVRVQVGGQERELGALVPAPGRRWQGAGRVFKNAGGQDSVELRAAMTIAELALFPIQPSLFDAATLETLAELVAQAQAFNTELVAAVVINRASPHPRVKEAEEAKELIAEYRDLHLLDVVIRDRIVFRKAARNGLCVLEFQDHDPAAEAELHALYREVFGDD